MKSLNSKEIDMILGNVIKRHRKAAGLSQSELGQAAGVTFQQIQKYESGQNRISVSRLFQLAETLGLEPASVVTEVQSATRARSMPSTLRVAATGH
jgi:transcriptional regulator with XRE-family HTH domain